MNTDRELLASERQNVIATPVVSTDSIVVVGTPGISRARGLRAFAQVEASFTGGAGTGITVELIQADNAALTANVEALGSSGVQSIVIAGTRLLDIPLPEFTKPYAGFRYTSAGGAYAAGRITAGFVIGSDTPYQSRPAAESHGGPGSGQQPTWSPLELGSKLMAWWDAEDVSSLSVAGGAVAGWTDLKGGMVLAQATSGFKPTWSATGFNGRPVVTFDGTDDELTAIGTGSLPIGSAPGEIWALVDQQMSAGTTDDRRMFHYGGSSANARALRRSVVGGVNRAYATVGDGSLSTATSNNAVDFTGRHIVRLTVSATDFALALDNQAGATVSSVAATSNVRTRMGASGAGSTAVAFFQGGISAILVTGALAAPEATNLYAFLSNRGAIA